MIGDLDLAALANEGLDDDSDSEDGNDTNSNSNNNKRDAAQTVKAAQANAKDPKKGRKASLRVATVSTAMMPTHTIDRMTVHAQGTPAQDNCSKTACSAVCSIMSSRLRCCCVVCIISDLCLTWRLLSRGQIDNYQGEGELSLCF